MKLSKFNENSPSLKKTMNQKWNGNCNGLKNKYLCQRQSTIEIQMNLKSKWNESKLQICCNANKMKIQVHWKCKCT